MVKIILTEAGFVENVTFKETRFVAPPRDTYAVYVDSYTRRGSDNLNFITEHNFSIELYEHAPDRESEKAVETALDNHAIPYDKEERMWLDDEQLYQVVYNFDHIEKK